MRETIERAIERLTALYENYQDALTRDLMDAVAEGHRQPERLRRSASNQLALFTRQFAAEFDALGASVIQRSVGTLERDGTRQTLRPGVVDLLGEYVDGRATLTRDAIVQQAAKDAQTVVSVYIRSLLAPTPEPFIDREEWLKYRDRSGRSWASLRFVAVELEAVFYELANIVAVYALIVSGEEFGQYDRPGDEADGQYIKLDDFHDLSKEMFYPGSKALVKMISY